MNHAPDGERVVQNDGAVEITAEKEEDTGSMPTTDRSHPGNLPRHAEFSASNRAC
jgi:hypothetical protein